VIRWLKHWTIDAWREIHEDSLPADPAEARRFDWRPMVILTMVTVSLIIQEYFGDRGYYAKLFPRTAANKEYWELGSYVWWSGFRVGGFLVLPALTIWLIPGLRVRDQHLSIKGFTRHIHWYLFLLAVVAPMVWIASQTPSFQHTYPFYRLAHRSAFDFWVWEALYVAQFISLEFFFRGVMLASLRRSLGAHALWVMVIPYVMIHFGKPVAETSGAVIAGIVLGTLAMRTRSIWGGVLVHCAVAIGMDLLAVAYLPPPK
jgi:membrane protease YdiL (CAAX protease family)